VTVRALRDRGFRALIAHPERHMAPDLAPRLAEAVADGALVQVTAAHAEVPELLALAADGLVHGGGERRALRHRPCAAPL
jgi:hypothetical protein